MPEFDNEARGHGSASIYKRIVGGVRASVRRARRALGLPGLIMTALAALSGIGFGAVDVAIIASSLDTSDVYLARHVARRMLALDRASGLLMHDISAASSGYPQRVEGSAQILPAWVAFQYSLDAVCQRPTTGTSLSDRLRVICDVRGDLYRRVSSEIEALDPPPRGFDPLILRELFVVRDSITELANAASATADALVDQLASDYRLHLFIMALSAGGFVVAGWVLMLMVGHGSTYSHEQWRKARDVHELLADTIEAVPAGIEDVVRETAKLDDTSGRPSTGTADDGGRRFPNRGERQVVGGRWFEWSESLTPAGHTVGLWSDVTELQECELALEATGRRLEQETSLLRAIVGSTGAMIVFLDGRLQIIKANCEFSIHTGAIDEAAEGRPAADFFELDPGMIDGWLSGRSTAPARFTQHTVDGRGQLHVWLVTATPGFDAEGRLANIVLLGVDDTERRQTEKALFDADRLATVGEMAATVVHELTQPLQVIGIACESLDDELSAARNRGAFPDLYYLKSTNARIGEQVERTRHIVNELRAFVRGTADEPAMLFDPIDAIGAAIDLTSHDLKRDGVVLTSSMAESLFPVHGHLPRLEQVLVNLIRNACDAGSKSIEIATETMERDGRSFVVITVNDRGAGIPLDVLPFLFVSFITTKPRGKGTGLGLRICRRIIEEMGGNITAANRPRGGASFQIFLPLESGAN